VGEDGGRDGSVIDASADAGGDANPCAGKAPVVVHSCASVRASWAPAYDPTQKRIELDVSALPVNVVSAQVIYYHSDGQAHGCGLASIMLEGKRVLATLQGDVAPTMVGISRLSLTDECGTRHDFELGSASACNALQWSQSSGAWACTTRTGACVDQC
jgi:hypothetical protein